MDGHFKKFKTDRFGTFALNALKFAKMKKLHKIPAWFNPYSKPQHPYSKPQQFLTNEILYEKELIDDNHIVYESASEIWRLERSYSSYGDEVYLLKLKKELVENKKYAKELQVYEEHKSTSEKRASEWESISKLWHENKKIKQENQEKRLYLSLKRKFDRKKSK